MPDNVNHLGVWTANMPRCNSCGDLMDVHETWLHFAGQVFHKAGLCEVAYFLLRQRLLGTMEGGWNG